MIHKVLVVDLPCDQDNGNLVLIHIRGRLWVLIEADNKLPTLQDRKSADQSKPQPIRGRGIDPRIFEED